MAAQHGCKRPGAGRKKGAVSKPLEYSPEIAGQILLDPDYDVFAGAVTWAAGIADSDNTEVAEEQAGNSKKPSSGN